MGLATQTYGGGGGIIHGAKNVWSNIKSSVKDILKIPDKQPPTTTKPTPPSVTSVPKQSTISKIVSAVDKVTTPTPSKSSGSRSVNKITDTQISQTIAVAEQKNIDKQIQEQESIIQGQSKLALVFQQKSYNDSFNIPTATDTAKNNINKLEQRKQSVPIPNLKDISVEEIMRRSNKGFSGIAGKDYIDDKTATILLTERNNQILLEARDREVGKYVGEIELNLKQLILDRKQQLQDAVNNGELNVDFANKVLDTYINTQLKNADKEIELKDKEWWNNRGKYIAKESKNVINNYKTLQTLRKLDIKKSTIIVGIGAAMGATGVVAIAGATAISPIFGAVTSIGLTTAGVGGGSLLVGKKSYDIYSRYKSENLTKIGAVAELILFGSETALGVAGAIGGTMAVNAIANYSYLNRNEKQILDDKILNRQNAIKTTSKEGEGFLTESDIKNLKIDANQKLELINQIKKGHSIQKVSIEVNRNGLTPLELKIVDKYNLKGTGYVAVVKNGNVVEGFGLFNLKAGRGVAIINPKLNPTIKVESAGLFNKNKLTGFKYSETYNPRKGIIKIGNEYNLAEQKLEFFKSEGAVKYFQEGDKIVRIDFSKSKSNLLRADFFDKQGNFLYSENKGTQGVSIGRRTSELIELSKFLEVSNKNIKYSKNALFGDIESVSFSGKKGDESLFYFTKVKPSINNKGFGIKQYTIENPNIVEGVTTATTQKTNPLNLIDTSLDLSSNTKLFGNLLTTPKPTYVGGAGGLLSESIYSYDSKSIFSSITSPALFEQTEVVPNFRSLITGLSVSEQKQNFDSKFIKPPTNSIEQYKFKSNLMFNPPMIIAQESPKINQLFANPLKTNQKHSYNNILALSNLPIQKQDQILKQEQIPLILNIPQINVPRFKPPAINPQFGLPPIFPTLPMFDLPTGGGQGGKKTKSSSLFAGRYNASLGSILLKRKPKKVTKEQYEKLSKSTFTGLELRPEIQIKEKKKKSIFNIF